MSKGLTFELYKHLSVTEAIKHFYEKSYDKIENWLLLSKSQKNHISFVLWLHGT